MNVATLQADLESAKLAHGAAVAAGGDTADASRMTIARLSMQLADAEALAEHERAQAETAAVAQDREDRAEALAAAKLATERAAQQAGRFDSAVAEVGAAFADLQSALRDQNRHRIAAGLRPTKALGTSATAGAFLAGARDLATTLQAARPPIEQRRSLTELLKLRSDHEVDTQ